MAEPIHAMITSLDGYVIDPDGDFGRGAPEAESHAFRDEHMKSIGRPGPRAVEVVRREPGCSQLIAQSAF